MLDTMDKPEHSFLKRQPRKALRLDRGHGAFFKADAHSKHICRPFGILWEEKTSRWLDYCRKATGQSFPYLSQNVQNVGIL